MQNHLRATSDLCLQRNIKFRALTFVHFVEFRNHGIIWEEVSLVAFTYCNDTYHVTYSNNSPDTNVLEL